jgi:hypothetical protein
MTETRAYVLLAAGGLAVETGIYLGVSAVGGSGKVFVMLTMFCLIATSFLVGVIGVRYEPDEEDSREVARDR